MRMAFLACRGRRLRRAFGAEPYAQAQSGAGIQANFIVYGLLETDSFKKAAS